MSGAAFVTRQRNLALTERIRFLVYSFTRMQSNGKFHKVPAKRRVPMNLNLSR